MRVKFSRERTREQTCNGTSQPHATITDPGHRRCSRHGGRALDWTDVAQPWRRRARPGGKSRREAVFSERGRGRRHRSRRRAIIPTDDSPGAREAGVVYFFDRALATFCSQLAGDYRSQLAAFQAEYRRPSGHQFVRRRSPSDQQIEHLKGVDQTPFFDDAALTLLGMLRCLNTAATATVVGWKLIGFEDLHVFRPPFGYYDRDYPGFVIDPVTIK